MPFGSDTVFCALGELEAGFVCGLGVTSLPSLPPVLPSFLCRSGVLRLDFRSCHRRRFVVFSKIQCVQFFQ
jgi:hypothetical protein